MILLKILNFKCHSRRWRHLVTRWFTNHQGRRKRTRTHFRKKNSQSVHRVWISHRASDRHDLRSAMHMPRKSWGCHNVSAPITLCVPYVSHVDSCQFSCFLGVWMAFLKIAVPLQSLDRSLSDSLLINSCILLATANKAASISRAILWIFWLSFFKFSNIFLKTFWTP